MIALFIITAKKVPRRGLALLLAALLLLAAFLLFSRRGGTDESDGAPRAASESERAAWLRQLGWELSGDAIESLSLTLPDELTEPWLSYNELQLQQGFDLTPWLGRTLQRYTYVVTNYPGRASGCQADLYLFEGTIVAGDIVCTGENGFIAPLTYPAGDG